MKVSIGWVVVIDNRPVRTGPGYGSRTSKVYRKEGTAKGVATQYGGAPRATVHEAFIEVEQA